MGKGEGGENCQPLVAKVTKHIHVNATIESVSSRSQVEVIENMTVMLPNFVKRRPVADRKSTLTSRNDTEASRSAQSLVVTELCSLGHSAEWIIH